MAPGTHLFRTLDAWLGEVNRHPDGFVFDPETARRMMPLILRGLGTDEEQTRLHALFPLDAIGAPGQEAEPILFALVDDEDEDIRAAAQSALIAVRPDSADRVRFLARFMWESFSGIPAALDQFAHDLRPIRETIYKQCRHPEPFARVWAGWLLLREELMGPRARAQLQELLEDESSWVRRDVAEKARDVDGLDIPWMDGDLDIPWFPNDDWDWPDWDRDDDRE